MDFAPHSTEHTIQPYQIVASKLRVLAKSHIPSQTGDIFDKLFEIIGEANRNSDAPSSAQGVSNALGDDAESSKRRHKK